MFNNSIFDDVTKSIVNTLREVQDIRTSNIEGSVTNVIRISETEDNMYGDVTYTYQSQIVENVKIEYPYKDVEMFITVDSETSPDVEAISIYDILPITMTVPFNNKEDIIDFDNNDILVDVLIGHRGNKIPVIFQSPSLVGSFYGKYVVTKKYELTLYRGTLESPIQERIDEYVNNLGQPTLVSSYPENNDTSIPLDASFSFEFNMRMNEASVENYFSITPEVAVNYQWESGIIFNIIPVENLQPSTEYELTIDENATSEAHIKLQGDITIKFITV